MSGPIIVAFDGHEAAERALARAVDEARSSQRRLIVLAVYEMPLDPAEPQVFGTLDDSRPLMLPHQAPPEAAAVLERARERIERDGAAADFVWAAGEPAEEIIRAARDQKASLIVVGTHHHSMLGRLFGEDVAGSVRHEARCEVEVVD